MIEPKDKGVALEKDKHRETFYFLRPVRGRFRALASLKLSKKSNWKQKRVCRPATPSAFGDINQTELCIILCLFHSTKA